MGKEMEILLQTYSQPHLENFDVAEIIWDFLINFCEALSSPFGLLVQWNDVDIHKR